MGLLPTGSNMKLRVFFYITSKYELVPTRTWSAFSRSYLDLVPISYSVQVSTTWSYLGPLDWAAYLLKLFSALIFEKNVCTHAGGFLCTRRYNFCFWLNHCMLCTCNYRFRDGDWSIWHWECWHCTVPIGISQIIVSEMILTVLNRLKWNNCVLIELKYPVITNGFITFISVISPIYRLYHVTWFMFSFN